MGASGAARACSVLSGGISSWDVVGAFEAAFTGRLWGWAEAIICEPCCQLTRLCATSAGVRGRPGQQTHRQPCQLSVYRHASPAADTVRLRRVIGRCCRCCCCAPRCRGAWAACEGSGLSTLAWQPAPLLWHPLSYHHPLTLISVRKLEPFREWPVCALHRMGKGEG